MMEEEGPSIERNTSSTTQTRPWQRGLLLQVPGTCLWLYGLFTLCRGNRFLGHNLDQQSRSAVHKLGIVHLGGKKGVTSISLQQKLLKAAALLVFKLLWAQLSKLIATLSFCEAVNSYWGELLKVSVLGVRRT